MSTDHDFAWDAGKYRAATHWLLIEIRALAEHYAPKEPGEAGHQVEGRVIASDLNALADVVESGLGERTAAA